MTRTRKANNSYGLTTFRDHHVQIRGSNVSFAFMGKSKKKHKIELNNRKLAKLIKECRDVPGQVLFQYRAPGEEHRAISSTDINSYLKEITGEDLSAKDFRTWAGTLHAALTLRQLAADSKTELKKHLRSAIEEVAERLGNTPAICRKSYIHPSIINSYLRGSLTGRFAQSKKLHARVSKLRGLRLEEKTVFTVLNCR